MTVQDDIERYIGSLAEPKRADLAALHEAILRRAPDVRLWFLDGRNDDGKIVSNPNIGYGVQSIAYANGKSRDFYRVGLSANTSGISLYIMGLDDKTLLARTYGPRLGKASVTGYCIRFKGLRDIDVSVLEEAIGFGLDDRRDDVPATA